MREVVHEADCIATKRISRNAHIWREADDLFLVDNELLFEAGQIGIRVPLRLFNRYRHAEQVIQLLVVHKDLSIGVPEERRQVLLQMADEGLESAVLDEALHESDHAVLHLIFVLLLDLVREDLHADSGQARDDPADGKVAVVPEAETGASSALAVASVGGSRRRRSTLIAHSASHS